MGNSGETSRKKLWIAISVAVLAVLLLITIIVALNKDESKFSVKGGQTIYKVEVTSTKINDMSDWEIKGKTSAPDGAKLFATYGDETNDEEYGVNAASSTSLTSWATVRNGKFTMIVDPLDLHYEQKYKSEKSMSAYLFAITGLKGKLSDYNIEPKISDALKSAIAKNVKKTNLNLSSSQASYYNSLGTSDDESSSSEDYSGESISSSESSRSASSESSVSSSLSAPQSSSSSTQSSSTGVPREYKSALNSADIYANTMHMSKAGLYEQLTADAGEKFSPEAAQYAVDNVKTDWNKNALESAKSYQEMDMSPESIREQLTSDAGEKFTQEQADYAIANLPQ